MNLFARVTAALDRGVDPEVFERCAVALMGTVYNNVEPVEGGSDGGRDADIYGPIAGDPDSRGRILVTTGDVLDNLKSSHATWRKIRDEGETFRVDQLVLVTHAPLSELPLPSESVDVVISNCVINLSTDKPAVLAEMHRVLTPGGRIGISDVVAEDQLTPADRAERGSFVGCVAGALSRWEYVEGLTAAGFTDASVEFTHEVAPGVHGAIVRATKPQL